MADSIKVLCRFRPQNSREKAENAYIVVRVSDDHTLCEIKHPDKSKQPKPLQFNFDCVFDWTSTQTEVYEHAASHLVEQIFDGFNATIFAYGQTGAGKTYSMEGKLGSPHRGIVPRTVEHIFEHIADAEEDMEYLLQVSYVEIYLEQLRDLLSPGNSRMRIRDSKTGVYIEHVTQMYVRDAKEVIDIMTKGSGNRTVNSTGMNAVSSRSHGVFMLKLTSKNLKSGSKKISKLMMIDLAGSEKVSKTGAQGTLLKEAQKINQSLSALGNVMAQLSSGKPHISYRDSVLTRLLSDSLGGNCKTTLLIAVSPSSFNADETITTCRFGVRAKKIKNKAKINAEKTVAEYKVEVAGLNQRIKGLQALVKALRYDLSQAKAGDLSTEDKGQSDNLIANVDMDFLMDDGKSKKKRKPKKKGFFREGYVPPAPEKKKKKEKKKGKEEVEDDDDDDDDEDEVKDVEEMKLHETTSTEMSFIDEDMVPAKQLYKAEERIKYLEKEVIKAQAAAATASGLGDAATVKSPGAHRQSILPKPHRPGIGGTPSVDLPGVGAMLVRQNSGRKSGAASPLADDDLPPSTEMLKKQASVILESDVDADWEAEKGDVYSELQIKPEVITKTVTETVTEMPKHLADLDPALLELARRELQDKNVKLRRWADKLIHELEQQKIKTQKKAEALMNQKHRCDDAEMECDRLELSKQMLQERVDQFEQDRLRERKQIESFKNENVLQQKEIDQLKQRLADKEKDTAAQIAMIRRQEEQKAKQMMQNIRNEFNVWKKEQTKLQSIQSMVPQPANGRSAYEMMSINEQQQRIMQEKRAMMQQMQRLKEATFQQLERIQMEQVKVKNALEAKHEECMRQKRMLVELDQQLAHYMDIIKEKDVAISRQTTELKAFGDLKLMSDSIHQREFKTAQDTIHQLKRQLKDLQQMNDKTHAGDSALENHQMQVMPTPIRGGGRKRKQNQMGKQSNNNNGISSSASPSPSYNSSMASSNVPTPIRGGSRVRSQHSSKTSDFFNSGLRKPGAHSLTPSFSYSPRQVGHKPSKSGQRSIGGAAMGSLGYRSHSAGPSSSSIGGYVEGSYGSGHHSGQSSIYSAYSGSGYNSGQNKKRTARTQSDTRRQKGYW